MTRGKKLLTLLAVLVLLLGTTALVRVFTAEPNEETLTASVVTIDTASVKALAWEYGETSFDFRRTDSGWRYTGDSAFPVSSTTLSNLLTTLNEMTIDRTIEGVTDLAEYGLDTPACTIRVTEDSTLTIRIGDETAMGGQRYVTLDNETVYLVEDTILAHFTVDLYAMLREESIPAMSNTTDVVVERKGADLVVRAETGDDDTVVWHGINGKEEIVLDTDLVKSFITDVTTLYWSDCVAYNADEAALKQYGLDDPVAILTVTYTETTQKDSGLTDSDGQTIFETFTEEKNFVLEFGDSCEEGIYARLSGSGMVYIVTEYYYEEMIEVTYEDLIAAVEETEAAE